MSKFLLVLHVLAVIVGLGPVMVASSMFPSVLRRATTGADAAGARGALGVLNRICRVYAAISIAVPVFGFGLASMHGGMGKPWLIASIILTVVAAGVLVFLLPAQQSALEALGGGPAAEAAPAEGGAATATATAEAVSPGRLAMLAGIFNLLWVVVAVLMIVRP
ncbi:membrane protein [Streptomyces sp. NRRL F-5126]|uniref:membrane protein n=1 Tax=Streptomyces sp. NRRL F-5126 TaxID=1463857 RepID=UPI0004C5642A|nr:membrane protein [Streptomyces sp. NRRL F-5126]